MIKVGIVGAAGYTGGELTRLLLHHPQVSLVCAQSKSSSGKPVSSVHSDLFGDTELVFSADIDKEIDVLFLCGGHGAGREFMATQQPGHHIKVIDLSQDFRLEGQHTVGERTFVYGLPEANRAQIATANSIANPGCFATALQLALLPLVHSGWAGQVYGTGITGSTGAGQALAATSHFSWRSNNIQPYKSLQHQHIAEVEMQLQRLHPSALQTKVNFVPWRGDFARGIMVSLQLQTALRLEELRALYEMFYAVHPFTHFSPEVVHLKQVVHTNKCIVSIEQHGGQTVIHAAIDNLLKGASGQALQNMNLMFGLPESVGLDLKAGYF